MAPDFHDHALVLLQQRGGFVQDDLAFGFDGGLVEIDASTSQPSRSTTAPGRVFGHLSRSFSTPSPSRSGFGGGGGGGGGSAFRGAGGGSLPPKSKLSPML
jgi:hypothetical protein